ncbi:MAG: immunoglobulin-like domain-containing protein, partial [Candidatus Paceibacterota bacterium]
TASTLSAGTHATMNAKQTDAAGNVSVASGNLSVDIDTTADAAPGTPDMTAGTDLGSSSTDNTTSDTTPDFTMSCVTGSTVTLFDNVTSVGTGACASSTVTITASTLSAGTHATMNAKQTDAAGNVSVASGNLSVDIDTTADAASGIPNMTDATDLGSSNSDNITSDTTPDFTISCVTGSTVTLFDNITNVGTGACASSTVTITASTLTGGTHATMNTKQTDPAGNVSVASGNLSIDIDTTAPTQTVSAVDISADTGTSASDFNTATASQTITGTLSGTLAAGETLYGSVNDGGAWTDITSMVSGTAISWTGATLSSSSNIIFKVTDLAGNDSVGGLGSITYTTSGTWIVPEGVTSITIDVRGGGGGGGGGGGETSGGDGGYAGLLSAIKRGSTTLIQARGGDGGDGGMSEFEDPGGAGEAGGTNTTGGLTLSALAGGAAGAGGSSPAGESGFIGQNGDKITGNYTPVTPGESLTIIVGAGGAGGAGGNGGGGGGDGVVGQVTLTYSSDTSTAYVLDTTAPTNQDSVLTSSSFKQGGASVTIVSSGVATNAVWLAPTGTTVFSAGTTMTTAVSGTATSILAPSAEGVYYLYILDLAGNISTASTATITVDATAPAGGAFTINSGATYASSTAVTLNITVPTDISTPIQMAYGETASPTNWETAATSASLTLSSGEVLKTVYVRFKDAADNTTSDITQTITLDTVDPTSVITAFCSIGGNECTSAGTSASPQELYRVQTISGTSADTSGSGVDSVSISIKDVTANAWYSGTSFIDPSETYLPATGTTTWSYDSVTVPLTIGHTYLIHSKAIDEAGNEQTATALSFTFVNSSPTVTNVTASEDSNGVVSVTYDVTDNESSQTTNSLFYKNSEDVFVAATSATGTGIGLSNIGTSKTISWTARTDADGFESGSGIIKVVANDGASGNNIGSMESSSFVLDAADPVGTLVLDVNAGTATLTGTDLSTITYLLQNGSSVTSGTSATVGSNAWTFSEETNKTVTALLSDPYGNETSITAVAPATPTSFQVKDITNLPAGVLGEALSWTKVTDVSGSTAESYEIWRATDSGASALLTTIDAANNTYSDLTVLNGHTYIYKVRALDTGGDYSAFSTIQSIAPSAVAITNVVSGTPTSSGVTITWTSDSFSNSVVQYGTTISYGSSQTGSDGNTKSHTVTLSGLTPATPYYFKVQSTDGNGNTSTNDNDGVGYPFTTADAFNITSSAGSNGTISPSGVTSVQTGANQIYTITPSAGYTIGTLTVDGSVIANDSTYTFTNVLATHTIDVTFVLNTYDITATAGENGTITPSGVTSVTSGADQAYTITPDAGYGVATLTVDGISLAAAESYTFTNVVATHTIAATFAQDIDTTPPVITLNGANPMSLTRGATFSDPGATALDAVDGDVTASIIITGNVNADVVGVYTLTYSSVDLTGNISLTTRTVNVVLATTYDIVATSGANGTVTPTGTTAVASGENQMYTI